MLLKRKKMVTVFVTQGKFIS